MTVHVAYRSEDHLVLGVFSSRKSAEEYRSRCSGSGRGVQISDHHVDGDTSDLEDTQYSIEEQCRSGWIG